MQGFACAVTFRFPTKADQKMAEHAIIAFDREGFSFRLDVFLRWHNVLIGFPIVRHDLGNPRALNLVPQLLPSYDPSGASDRSRSTAIQTQP